MYRRNIRVPLLAALSDSPVVLLEGARQTGKSTLACALAAGEHPARYVTLDDAVMLAAAGHDAAGFVAGFEGPVVIDEVQRVPELFLAIKASVDRDRRPGRFLLTGSADVLLLPKVADSLAGRMELLTLWPLSQGEIAGVEDSFVDAVFASRLPKVFGGGIARSELVERLVHGGYPEALRRAHPSRRRAWFASYVTTVLQRDIRNLAHIEGLTALPRLLSLLATRCGSLLNTSELSRTSGLPNTTLKRYLALFETAFLVHLLPAWAAGLESRLVKSPRLFLCDTGLACHLMGLQPRRLDDAPNLLGPLLENFVLMELRKQCGWSDIGVSLYHYRTHTGQEVDVVLESGEGRVVGLEVKASTSLGAGDLKGLKALQEVAGSRFLRGIVLYGGSEPVAFGSNLYAWPWDALWRVGASNGSLLSP